MSLTPAQIGRANSVLSGSLPAPPDVIIRRAHAWRLSTVNAWNPTVAERCSRMMVDRALSEQRP